MRAFPLVAAALLALAAARVSAVETPLLLTQHGRLLDSNDQPVDGPVKMKFTLYRQASAAGSEDPSWWASSEMDVQVSRGIYAVQLGTSASGMLPASAFEADGERWLGVTVNGTELTPRLRLGTVPFAQRAASALHADLAAEATHAAAADLATRATSADALGSACAGCVSDAHLASGAVTGAKIAAGSVTGGTAGIIADGSITADDLAAGAVTGAKIASQTITKANVAPKSLDASVIDTTSLDVPTVGGFGAAASPAAGKLFPLGQNAKFPASVIDVDALPFFQAGPSLSGAQLAGSDAQAQGLLLANNELVLSDVGFGAGTTDLEVLSGQVRVLPDGVNEFRNVVVRTGGTLTVNAWNGAQGGKLQLKATGSITVESGATVTVAGKGYRGGRANPCNTTASRLNGCHGMGGESFAGLGFVGQVCNANGGGGAGGAVDTGNYGEPGGGGSYGTVGTAGLSSLIGSGICHASPGNVYGDDLLTTLHLGAGGGSGGTDEDHSYPARGGNGGNGGGAISLEAASISISGLVTASGDNGENAQSDANNGGGGGGAGGSILLRAKSVTVASSGIVRARGGVGGNGLGANNGGNGGDGRLLVQGQTINGLGTFDINAAARRSDLLSYVPSDKTRAVYVSPALQIPSGRTFARVDLFTRSAPGTHVLAEFCAATTASGALADSCFRPIAPSGAVLAAQGASFGRVRLTVTDRSDARSFSLVGISSLYQ